MCVFSLDGSWFPPCLNDFFFSFPFFFFSATWLLVSLFSPRKDEEGEGETNKVEGEGLTLVSNGC